MIVIIRHAERMWLAFDLESEPQGKEITATSSRTAFHQTVTKTASRIGQNLEISTGDFDDSVSDELWEKRQGFDSLERKVFFKNQDFVLKGHPIYIISCMQRSRYTSHTVC